MEERDVLRMQRVEVLVGYVVIFDRPGIVLFGQRVNLQMVLNILYDTCVVIPSGKTSDNNLQELHLRNQGEESGICHLCPGPVRRCQYL